MELQANQFKTLCTPTKKSILLLLPPTWCMSYSHLSKWEGSSKASCLITCFTVSVRTICSSFTTMTIVIIVIRRFRCVFWNFWIGWCHLKMTISPCEICPENIGRAVNSPANVSVRHISVYVYFRTHINLRNCDLVFTSEWRWSELQKSILLYFPPLMVSIFRLY
jgi:hypothetical protein